MRVLAPRLTNDQAVALAVLLDAAQVAGDDPRLADIDAFMWCPAQFVAMVIPEAWLVEWPDGALGFALLSPESEIPELLIAAYAAARTSLEMRALTHLSCETTASH